MDEWARAGYPQSPQVSHVVEAVVSMLRPQKIYLYNQKTSLSGEITGFKLCVVAEFAGQEAKEQAERDIYLHVDSEVPFDVLLYTPGEWRRLCGEPGSFAGKIQLTGMVVYG